MTAKCQYLKLNARFCDGSERGGLPVCLLRLLPHDHVEAAAVLVAEEEARVVVIGHRVHVEGAFEVHPVEGCVPWGMGSRSGAAELQAAHRAAGVEGTPAARVASSPPALRPHQSPVWE